MSNDTKRFQWGKINYILLALAVVLITVSYIIMKHDDITISPILLVISYVILIPMAILIKGKD